MSGSGWLTTLVIVLLLGGAVWLGAQFFNTQPATPPQTSLPNTNTGIGGGPGDATTNVREVTVEGTPFQFNPSEIRVKKGETVRVTFKNNEGFHDWGIDEFNVRTKQISAGESDTVEFVADQAGTFEYYCSVGNHRQMGMVGTLIVEE